jgi:hypothetical protein
MMFALTRSNLLRQLPDVNEIIRRLVKNMSPNNSIGIYLTITIKWPKGFRRDVEVLFKKMK